MEVNCFVLLLNAISLFCFLLSTFFAYKNMLFCFKVKYYGAEICANKAIHNYLFDNGHDLILKCYFVVWKVFEFSEIRNLNVEIE